MVYFATSTDVIQYTGVDSSVSAKVIDTMIGVVQVEQLKPILGNDKYAELEGQIKLSNLSDDNKSLLNDDIFPFIAWASLHLAIVPMHMKLKDKGVRLNSDDTSNPAGMQEFYAYKSFVGERMDAAKRRLKEKWSEIGKTGDNKDRGTSLYSFLNII